MCRILDLRADDPESAFVNNILHLLLMQGFFFFLFARNNLFHPLHLTRLNLAANEAALCFQGLWSSLRGGGVVGNVNVLLCFWPRPSKSLPLWQHFISSFGVQIYCKKCLWSILLLLPPFKVGKRIQSWYLTRAPNKHLYEADRYFHFSM